MGIQKIVFRIDCVSGEAWSCLIDIRWYDYQGTYPLDTASSKLRCTMKDITG